MSRAPTRTDERAGRKGGAHVKFAEEIARDLPPEYELRHDARAYLVSARAASVELANAGYGLHTDGPLSVSALAGRTPLLELGSRGGALLVRRFSHGGLLRWLTRSRFGDPSRPFRELCVSRSLARAGVATPEVVAARARRASVLGWHLDLVTRRVADAIDLGHLVASARRGELSSRAWRRTLRSAGAFVRRLHDAGCLHADLTPNNMLVEKASLERGDPRLWIVDLDGAKLGAAIGDCERRDNLRRLVRFVERREERHGRLLTRADYARFLHGYDPQRVLWKRDWIAIEHDLARNDVWHRSGWLLERLLGKKHDARESSARERASSLRDRA
jgi:hypothetical protein